MPTLTINFTPPTPNPILGYSVKYRLVGTSFYNIINPNPLYPPIIINDLDSGMYEGTIQAICDLNSAGNPIPFETTVDPEPCDITADVTFVSTGTTTVDATAYGTSGVAPYTYIWSTGQTTQTVNGLIKNNEYTVRVTDFLGCFVDKIFTPNVEVINGLKMEVMYFEYFSGDPIDPFYPRLCTGGHNCNRARFEVFANSISQGIANLNNLDGTSIEDGTIDDKNYPPNYPNYIPYSPYDRYWTKTLSGEDAASIANPDGTVLITLEYTGIDNNPHSSATWIRFSKQDGTILDSTCLNLFSGYTFNPYN